MKKIVVLLFAGMALAALCAFTIMKTSNAEPKQCAETHCCHAGGTWVRLEDENCNKCVINDIDRKCGKCGGFMEGDKGQVDGHYMKYKFTCKKCKHTCVYKVKY